MRTKLFIHFLFLFTILIGLASPALSQDDGSTTSRERIAFVSFRDGNGEIYAIDPDGGNPYRLTMNDAYEGYPVWSPDGTQIMYTTTREGDAEIYIAALDGSSVINLTNWTSADVAYSWAANGTIAFSTNRDGNFEVYTMNEDGGEVTRLTDNAGADDAPHLSPDGERIAFISNRDSADDTEFDLYVMNTDGTGLRRLTETDAMENVGGWSPGGDEIAFCSNRDGDFDIYVMDVETADTHQITRNTNANDCIPKFSSDGSQLLFSSDRDGEEEIYIMNADGTDQRRLTESDGADGLPVWSPVPVAITLTNEITEAAGVNLVDTAFGDGWMINLPETWLVWNRDAYTTPAQAVSGASALYEPIGPTYAPDFFSFSDFGITAIRPHVIDGLMIEALVEFSTYEDVADYAGVPVESVSLEEFRSYYSGLPEPESITLHGRPSLFSHNRDRRLTGIWVMNSFPDEQIFALTQVIVPNRYFETAPLISMAAATSLRRSGEEFDFDTAIALVAATLYDGGTFEAFACEVRAINNANLRGGPGTGFAVVGSLAAGESASVTGQATGDDGMVWWRIAPDGTTWVRSDLVTERGDCESMPDVG